jgi:uncharacterized protein
METNAVNNSKKIRWGEIIIFYLVSVLISAPFRLGYVNLGELIPLPYGLNIFYRILRGIGPAIGFLTVYYIMKSKVDRKLTFWGVNKYYSILAAAVIPLSLGIVGVSNAENLDKHYYGLISGIFLIFYALGEEYGWRAYLQQALEPMKILWRVLLIAVLWYVWHLNFLLPDFTIKTHLVFFGFLVLGSWGLLKISESTYSILFVAAVHLAFNVLSDVHGLGNNKIIVIVIATLIWTLLMISLVKKRKVVDSNKVV